MKRFIKRRNAGVAMDETVLVTVMAGTLGTFGAVAVPWDDVLGRSASAQGLNQFEVIESANARFRDLYGQWPHEMTGGKALDNVVVLVSRQALKYPYSRMEDFRAVTTDLAVDISTEGAVVHHMLGGGRIMQRPAPAGSGYRMEIVFENVPLTSAEEIDRAADGESSPFSGRVRLQKTGDKAHVIYRANKV